MLFPGQSETDLDMLSFPTMRQVGSAPFMRSAKFPPRARTAFRSAVLGHPPRSDRDLPLVFHPAATGARWLLICPPTLDRPKAEFSGFVQGDGLVTPPDFVSLIGTLLPIAPCGRSSL